MPAPTFGVILIGSLPEGLISVNRKDWLSALNLRELAVQRKNTRRISISSKLLSKEVFFNYFVTIIRKVN